MGRKELFFCWGSWRRGARARKRKKRGEGKWEKTRAERKEVLTGDLKKRFGEKIKKQLFLGIAPEKQLFL